MITLTINGTQHELDIAPDMPLLWALRDVVGLTGTKYGCGIGVCGSCKVLLDGVAMQSCITPVSAAAGKQIVTIEGQTPNLQRLQVAWAEMNVAQCGYCQPGQLITATALLDTTPQPTAEQVDAAMTGNICRCGTYPRIRKAILSVAQSPNKD